MNEPVRVTLALARRILGQGPLDREQRRVFEHIENRQPISADAAALAELKDTFGNRLADTVARIGGSWPFIGGFFLFLISWTGLNTVMLANSSAFDPYPYIFLNLLLSMLAAIQAPIIMMSQNRQAAKDRVAAAHDYEVNLRSELEILGIQEKLDRLRGEQHERILAQQAQMIAMLERLENQSRTS